MFHVLLYTLATVFGLMALAWVLNWWLGLQIRAEWERRHGSGHRRVLLIYSRSPNWEVYIETELIPRLQPHVVTLNWSDRKVLERSKSLEWRVFRRYRPEQGFNPLAIVLPRRGPVETISLWQAFREYKHGKAHTLRAAESHLVTAVAAAVSGEHELRN